MKIKFYVLLVISFLLIYPVNAQIDDDTETIDSVLQKKGEYFLLPSSIYKNITNRISKEKLIKDLNLTILNHRGGVDYYQVNETLLGMRFSGQYLSEISFRYFGDEGLKYESTLMKSGFLLKKRSKSSSIEIEPDFEAQTLDGEIRIYKKGSIVCQVYDGTYIGFTFYKTISTK